MVFTTKSAVLLRDYFVIPLAALVLPSSAQPLSVPDEQLVHSVEQKDVAGCLQALAEGADVNLRGPLQQTLLIYACDNEEIVQTLLEAGAAVDAEDRFGRTALMYTKSATVAQALLGAGAKADAKNRLGWTALHWAVWKNVTAVIAVLLQAEPDEDGLARLEDVFTTLGLSCWKKGLQGLSVKQKCHIAERAGVITNGLKNRVPKDLVQEVKGYLLTQEQWDCVENLSAD